MNKCKNHTFPANLTSDLDLIGGFLRIRIQTSETTGISKTDSTLGYV